MLQKLFKVFLFITVFNFLFNSIYAEEKTFRDGKEWKELNFGLIKATQGGKLEKVKDLLGRGAIVKTKNRFGNTALHYAARNNHIEIFNVLIKAGAQHDLPSLANKTPFLEASCRQLPALSEVARKYRCIDQGSSCRERCREPGPPYRE